MSEQGGEQKDFRVPNPSWKRKGRKADLTDVSVHKIDKANRERGIEIDLTTSPEGKRIADVNKTVVKGDD